MGNTKQALQQITEELEDINQAIEFCKEHDDKELWEDLIQCSLDKPSNYFPYFLCILNYSKKNHSTSVSVLFFK